MAQSRICWFNSFRFFNIIPRYKDCVFFRKMSFTFSSVSHDVQCFILSFLYPKDVFRISIVSKSWEFAEVARSDNVWKSKFETLREELQSCIEKKEAVHLSKMKKYIDKYIYLQNLCCFCHLKDLVAYIDPKYKFVVDNGEHKNLLDRDIKVVLVGDVGVGKTCLLVRFCKNKWCDKYIPTIMDDIVAKLKFNNEKFIGLNLWDTAGQQDYDTLRPLAYQETDVFLLCFSLDNRESFLNLHKWYDEVMQYAPDASIVVCGTKCDLRKEKQNESAESGLVRVSEACFKAKQLGSKFYVETSAKDGSGLTQFGCFWMVCFSYVVAKIDPEVLKKNWKQDENNGCIIL